MGQEHLAQNASVPIRYRLQPSTIRADFKTNPVDVSPDELRFNTIAQGSTAAASFASCVHVHTQRAG